MLRDKEHTPVQADKMGCMEVAPDQPGSFQEMVNGADEAVVGSEDYDGDDDDDVVEVPLTDGQE